MTKAEAGFNIALRPRKPEGSLGRTAQDGHLDSHTAPELCHMHAHNLFFLLFQLTDVLCSVCVVGHEGLPKNPIMH